MPRPRTPLPAPARTRPFLAAEAAALGITRQVLRHPRFATPFNGIRVLSAQLTSAAYPSEAARNSALHYRPRLRVNEMFSHSTALLLHGCPIRTSAAPHVSILRPGNKTSVRGAQGHTHLSPIAPWRHHPSGAPIAPPALALTQAAAGLPFRELVVAADHLIRPRREHGGIPIAALAELKAAAATAQTRGVRKLRTALSVARAGAESRMETLLRLVLVGHGLPALPLQVEIHDARGAWIGRFDMADLVRKLIVEYDGEQHRTSDRQYARDASRLERARDAGYRVLRFRHADVLQSPRDTARRVADALGMPLALPPEPLRGYLRDAGDLADPS